MLYVNFVLTFVRLLKAYGYTVDEAEETEQYHLKL